MIDSGLFSRSTVFNMDDMAMQLPQQLKLQQNQISVNKSIIYHMIHSFIKTLFQDKDLSKQQKYQACFQYGFDMGMNFVQQESFGYVKYFIPKNQKQAKPFLPQMKLLNSRIWTSVFSSNCKLFAIVSDTSAASYKIQDLDFQLTKFLSCSNNQRVKDYTKLVYEFAKGTIWGFLQKMNLNAQVNFIELTDNKIAVEVKNIMKKVKLQNF